MSEKVRRLKYTVHSGIAAWLCSHGVHYPITWSDSAYPGSYLEPPEPGWACEMCGEAFSYGNYRMQLRAWLTPLWWIEWRQRRWEAKDARSR